MEDVIKDKEAQIEVLPTLKIGRSSRRLKQNIGYG